MRPRPAQVLLITLLVLTAGCREAAPQAEVRGDRRPTVFVAIPPQAGITRRIAGDAVDVEVLAPPGTDPHTFEITPRRMAELMRADACLSLGVDFEGRILAALRDRARPRIFATNAGVAVIYGSHVCGDPGHQEAADADHEHAHQHAGQADPHIWMDPRRMRTIATNIRDALIEIDPPRRATYTAGCAELLADLDALDREFSQLLAPFAGREFYVFHPAYTYFADAYGLVQVPIEHDGKEPRGQWLSEAIRRIAASTARIIFFQPQFDRAAASVIAEETGGRAIAWDPLALDYLGELRRMQTDLRTALAGSD